jgi:predicted transcriptional regulator
MLSDRDILRRLNVIDGEVEIEMALTVSDVMQQEVISTDSISDIRRVARVMAFHHVEAIPVTRSEGNLIGIVTRGDILRSFAENPRLNLWG